VVCETGHDVEPEVDVTKGVVVLFGSWLAALIVASVASAETIAGERALVVSVRDYAKVAPVTLHRAMDEVARIFRRTGIQVSWIEGADAVRAMPRLHLIVLDREIPELREEGHLSLGAAPRLVDVPGHVAYVFREPIEYLSAVHAVDDALVLAHAIAHELGHLLLPSGHSPEGLMAARWGAREVRAASWGTLMFSPRESSLIRAALASPAAPAMARR
jgi:hypothetical protein